MARHELDVDDDDVSADLSRQFLTAADFSDGLGRRFVIARVEKQVFEAKNGFPEEQKRVLVFTDNHQLGLNQVNLRLLVDWFGPKTRAWIGKTVTVYRDDSVSFGGRQTGGWRLRKPLPPDVDGLAQGRDSDLDGLQDVPF